MISMCENTIYHFIRVTYPWISCPRNWNNTISILQNYIPKLYVENIVWRKPKEGKVKCNCDGASKGNPGRSSYAFCVRNHQRGLLWAEAGRIGFNTNTKAEAIVILKCL